MTILLALLAFVGSVATVATIGTLSNRNPTPVFQPYAQPPKKGP